MRDVNSVYFKNLNGLRFIAAAMVIFDHIEQSKGIFGINNYYGVLFFGMIGKLGVMLFFVISGFLITFLLLEEQQKTGRISVWRFYMRRILRIWPLYFLMVILSFFVVPHMSLFTVPGFEKAIMQRHLYLKLAFFLFFSPNIISVISHVPFYSGIMWSIGTEEQFYLMWPHILKTKFNKYVIVLSVLSFYLLVKFMLWLFAGRLPYGKFLTEFWSVFNIDCMAMGALAALILQEHNEKYLRWLFNGYFYYGTLLLLVTCIAGGFNFPIKNLNNEFYACLFTVIVLNLVANPNNVISLENSMMKYLGKISYGLYMYHFLSVIVTIKVAILAGLRSNLFICPAVFCLTILLASISYYYFEGNFLHRKIRYSAIISGDAALENAG